MKWRIQVVRENAGEDMELRVPVPPEAVCKGRVSCGHCSTSHTPFDRSDTHPQCPWCGNLIDLTAHFAKAPPFEHGPDLTPAA